MAGEGSRYKQEGYTTPKPLIEVMGVPMVVRAAQSLPKADHYIFVCRDFHITEYQIDKELKKWFPNSTVIAIDYLTEGQASTCLLAKEYINNDEPLVIGASDNGMIWEETAFAKTFEASDAQVWTFRHNVTVVPKPEQYGWVAVDNEQNATKVSVKIPISDNPLQDHAVIGAFSFKKGSDFVKAAESMIAKNRRIKGEFYVDELMNELIESGQKVKAFEADKYICWGTPDDLRTFQYWEGFFAKLKK
ncbi:Nucleotidyl transferase [Flexibacter flexilis DSM 6793]|uniref:Nucleotidyl transferase n=2 Tax=Flexibacter flexilis TaxID=998 RepID=A0A1I1H000_9BACT|nr:Nucleotidyl transferase [Flexibacter flexilis DSM 6793]